MNTLPKLFVDASWSGITAYSPTRLLSAAGAVGLAKVDNVRLRRQADGLMAQGSTPKQRITRLSVVDSAGKSHVLLAITPLDRVQTYHGIRVEEGIVRYELNDGTPVRALSRTEFEIVGGGTKLTIATDNAPARAASADPG